MTPKLQLIDYIIISIGDLIHYKLINLKIMNEHNDVKKNGWAKKLTILFLSVFCIQLVSFAKDKPNSKFGGVQIGTITYSYRSMPDQSLPAILEYIVQSGINSVELMGEPVEEYAGIPKSKDREVLKKWRSSVSLDKFKEIRKMFDEKGVEIHILKLGDHRWSDAEIDYAFEVANVLGAKGISMEISEEAAQRMEPFAEKHQMYVIFHNHFQPAEPTFSFDKILAYGPMIMLNFDAGHYYGVTGLNPCDLIQRLHERIFSIHIKDKTGPKAIEPNKNMEFGKGETPVKEILQLIKKNKWPIYCDIELEYDIPQGSDAVKEVIKCVDYCKKALR
ncbi:MAG TPA: sugar phosphate isomerase/epimerase [Dysgonamonadaceae bacterium]|jgi:sugar phosphate isomerase/epimerase|nr:sugar phosphate isomerase/epimerase [Dysgonamonadaceae bacterium]